MAEPLSEPHRQCSSVNVVRTIRTGSSGATVRIIRQHNGTLIAIKSARHPRVSARQQADARDVIAPFLRGRLPRVLFAGEYKGKDTLITECPSITTLADAVAANDCDVTAVTAWGDVVGTLSRVWGESARPGFEPDMATRNHALRLRRGLDGLHVTARRMGLPEESWRHVVVNNTDRGSLESILGRLATIPLPAMHVACQGDPQPRNVLLNATGRWHLVDWEWAGLHHDWRMLTSHLVGWWHLENLLTGARGYVSPTRSAVSLSYELPRTPTVPMTTPVAKSFHNMTMPGYYDRDLTALALHTAMLLIREISKAIAGSRPHLFAPLLGEAIRLIDSTRSDALHPLLLPFLRGNESQGRAA